MSLRLGVHRAEADVKLARANAYSDVYVLWQPYTFQDNSPYGLKSQYLVGPWVRDRAAADLQPQSGGISRAKINRVTQTELQLGDVENAGPDRRRGGRPGISGDASGGRRAVAAYPPRRPRQVRDNALKLYREGAEASSNGWTPSKTTISLSSNTSIRRSDTAACFRSTRLSAARSCPDQRE